MKKIEKIIKKIKELVQKAYNRIGADGLLHYFACFSITAIYANYVNVGLAFFAGIFIGFLKEIIWDGWLKKGTFELKDLICDIAGSVTAFLILLPKVL